MFKKLELLLKHQEIGISPESFRENLVSLEEAGFKPPPEEKWPPLYEELPYEAQEALRIFYVLPNKIDGMAGYTGKDLSALETIFSIYEVPVDSRKTIFNIVLFFINNSIESAVNKVKKEQKKQKVPDGN